jgi:hypothetical protein
MAFAGLMDAREDRINNTEARAASDASARSTLSGTHRPVGVGAGYERSDDTRPNRDDASCPLLRGLDGSTLRSAIPVSCLVSGKVM